MTMDIRRRSGHYSEGEQPKAPAKRSFDVAFLMAPDEGAKARRQEQLRLVATDSLLYPPKEEFPRSAFTKVNKEAGSPGPAVSPVPQDLLDSPNSRSPTYYPKYLPKPYFREKTSPELEQAPKRFAEVVPYGMAMAYPFIPPAPPALLAANVSALLPSSLAALTLPAQNVCAKCNISFRMTSDLVYHMRSQHKGDHGGSESGRRRVQDKLRCPVCNESFRERHHLTRHMTAHQDKDGDQAEEPAGRRRGPK